MITVFEALNIVLSQVKDLGSEKVSFKQSVGRVLVQDIVADRDFPPYNRSTMDGIAINFADFKAGITKFKILAVQAAGDTPVKSVLAGNCVQIMTGGALPKDTDTVIPIEEIRIIKGRVEILTKNILRGQFVHLKGSDKSKGHILIKAGQRIATASIPVITTVGQVEVTVTKNPKVVIISTGNELVDIDQEPSPYQIRKSNNYAVEAILNQYKIEPALLHLPDDRVKMTQELKKCLTNYDVIILSGGVSKGNFDYIPQIMTKLKVKMLFHGIEQKPGKPFWFGTHSNGITVFALPGNPVSTFLCLHKYVLPWLRASLKTDQLPTQYAVLNKTIDFKPKLEYFLQVKLSPNKAGQLIATPINHNGSGDFVNLTQADGFIELPANKTTFKKGDVYKILTI